jgi:iron-sulfur cluster protein
MSKEFDQSILDALKNPNIAAALGKFSVAYPVGRAKAFEGIDFEALRNQIAERKGYAADHLEELAATFAKNAEARGAKVFRANSPEAARDYVLKLCKEKGVKTLVKSKSMASEEIHLNHFLEAAGVSCKETDLGEWIIQLCGQRPSHMVMPAIHMTREQVAEIFSKEVNERLAADIPRLVKVARAQLRSKFLAAEMGMSGANIAVAETGTLTIITNEGNGRMVGCLPNVHVILVGLEKLVEKLEDVVPIITALPKAATGQLLTSYVSFITGPAQNTDGSTKELHIVLLDNRRTEMARDPKFKQALQCIRCASCLNVCPVFRLVGGHVFGAVYTGGIGTILTAWFDELKKSEDIQGLCIQCGKCNEVCPSKIDIAGLILELRRRLAAKEGLPFLQKAIFSVVNNRRLFHGMLRAAYLGQKPFVKGGYIRHLPLSLSKLTQDRSLFSIAAVPFRDRFKEMKQPKCEEKASFFAGCLMDFGYPEMGEAVVRILNKAGIEVVFKDEQTCCGAPARISGAVDVAANNAIDNIKALIDPSVKYIVCACPTCTVALKDDFIKVLGDEGKGEWLDKAKAIADKAIDFSTLVKELVDEGRLQLKEGQDLGKATYHDSCHYKRSLHAQKNPRELLKKGGFELAEMFESDVCCGMGGSYFAKHPEMSAPILKRKLECIKETGAKVVAADCPGCVMQIRGGFDKIGDPIEVKHTVEVLERMLK